MRLNGANGNGHGQLGEILAGLDARDNLKAMACRILSDTVADLKSPPRCSRYTTAIAWVLGRFPCACRYECSVMTFAATCKILGFDRTAVLRHLLEGFAVPEVEPCGMRSIGGHEARSARRRLARRLADRARPGESADRNAT